MKEFWNLMWGDRWTGMDSIGRWLVLFFAAVIVGAIVWGVYCWRVDRRFINSCYAAGGHVHYSYRSVPGVGVIVGNVVVPTTSTVTTMTFAEGSEDDCKQCRS